MLVASAPQNVEIVPLRAELIVDCIMHLQAHGHARFVTLAEPVMAAVGMNADIYGRRQVLLSTWYNASKHAGDFHIICELETQAGCADGLTAAEVHTCLQSGLIL